MKENNVAQIKRNRRSVDSTLQNSDWNYEVNLELKQEKKQVIL
jgi:hypothetical protein